MDQPHDRAKRGPYRELGEVEPPPPPQRDFDDTIPLVALVGVVFLTTAGRSMYALCDEGTLRGDARYAFFIALFTGLFAVRALRQRFRRLDDDAP